MEAYIHISDSAIIRVPVINSPTDDNEIIIGGTRFSVSNRDKISCISILPGIITNVIIKTIDNEFLRCTLEKLYIGEKFVANQIVLINNKI